MTDNKIERGDFVISLAGRDSGRIFIVADVVDSDYVTLTDGMLRNVEKPKKKKRKHVSRIDIPPYDGVMSNRAVSLMVKKVTAAKS
jgi:ribosomal protein L14E/L6E/L27E